MIKTRTSTRCVASLAALVLLAGTSLQADENRNPDPKKEQALIETLRSAAPAEKAVACKQLAIHGTKQAVPELARLLADDQLASWARIALEAIPDPAADEALRNQLNSLNGKLLVGVMNSIGVRRDQGSVDLLKSRLNDQDAEVASAAAVALGHIGNSAATKALRQILAGSPAQVRSAVAEGCILCAERLMADGKTNEAAGIYDEVRRADVPKQRILEATRGAILARKSDGVPLLIEQLESSDKALFQIALSTARELTGPKVAEALAAQLTKTKPERAVLLLAVLADRGESVIPPAVIAAATRGDQQVRIAAIGVVGRLGDASSLPTLLEIAADTDAELAQSAKEAIAVLQGEKVNAEIAARLPKADAKALPILIELVGLRRIDSKATLTKAIDHPDDAVRRAALAALGATVGPQDLSLLISRSIDPKYSTDADVAGQALKAACVRMPDREACAAELATAMSTAPITTQAKLLEILAAVGGQKALQTIAAAAKSDDERLPDTATRVLGEWMNVDAGPVLLDLAKTAPADKYRVRALRGYIRLARQFATSSGQRAEMCQHALSVATRVEEQKLVLAILQRHPNADSLQVAVKAMKTPALRDEAAGIALSIAQKLGVKSDEAQELLTETMRDPVKLEIIKAEYGAGTTQKDVTHLLKQHAGNLRWIILPSPNYNQSFGGDPAPDVVKQLKVQYRMNGKTGDASFAENTLVVLPMPK